MAKIDNEYIGIKGVQAEVILIDEIEAGGGFELGDMVYTPFDQIIITSAKWPNYYSQDLTVPITAPLAIIAIEAGIGLVELFVTITLSNGFDYPADCLALADPDPEPVTSETKKGYVEDVPADSDDIMKAVRDICGG